MGLIKDAIGSALGATQVSNGFDGPNLPFMRSPKGKRNDRGSRYTASQQSLRSFLGYFDEDRQRSVIRRTGGDYYDRSPVEFGGRSDATHHSNLSNNYTLPPAYEECQTSSCSQNYSDRQMQYQDSYPSDHRSLHSYDDIQDETYSRFPLGPQCAEYQDFRPVALPQIAFGDGQPFLRGYSYELERFGISEEQFFQVVDSINVAVIPSPEVQLFQKAASIAGFFLPVGPSLGLMAGQICIGVGAAFGHASLLGRNLAKANLEIFVPNGLEICIGKTKNLNTEVYFDPMSLQQPYSEVDMCPEDRVAIYGHALAPLTRVLPPVETGGRQDPIAALGRGMNRRQAGKKLERATKDLSEGKVKKWQRLEKGLKWLIVRRATPDATAHWQETLQQSNIALEQERVERERQRIN